HVIDCFERWLRERRQISWQMLSTGRVKTFHRMSEICFVAIEFSFAAFFFPTFAAIVTCAATHNRRDSLTKQPIFCSLRVQVFDQGNECEQNTASAGRWCS
ncbi:unnamed protein product, partial [Ectocarpus sp. 12 AP-2014]